MSARTTLTLANGCGIDLLDPKPSNVDFDAYAEQLAKEKRFNGATPAAEYSVAEHQSRGADAILQLTGDAKLAAYFSVHDAHEAVLKDLTTPLKRAMAELCHQQFGISGDHILFGFRELELRHDAAIHDAAGLVWPMPAEMLQQVKHWDLVMFVTEWRDLMNVPHPNWAPYADIQPLKEVIHPWDWVTAKRGLLRRWHSLLPSLKGTSA